MMRRAFFGTNALILLAFHLILILLDVFQVLPYVATLFYVMINIMALMLAVLGYWERDKLKFPGLIGLILGSGALIFWVVALVLRIQSAGG
ncbi:MAG TPA: hypothetical protein ENJ82_02795 [Bacteroidetes bacterium]|nr:hypothetical protein [Bacteroidota bacterium]